MKKIKDIENLANSLRTIPRLIEVPYKNNLELVNAILDFLLQEVDAFDALSSNIFEALREDGWKMCVCCFHYKDVILRGYRYLLLVTVVPPCKKLEVK
jgi:hypothetical protein